LATATKLIVLGICWTLVGFIVYHRSLCCPSFERQTFLYLMSKRKSYNIIQLPSIITVIVGVITVIASLIIAIKPK
jgi:hypothetical protein